MSQNVKSVWVDGIHYWHRLYSVRFSLLTALLGALTTLLPLWGDYLPPVASSLLIVGCSLGAAISSLVKQPALLEDIEKDKQDAR